MSAYDDSFTREGAHRLARKIEEYWRAQGGPVPRVAIVEGPFLPSMRSARFDVRSDMVNGKPQPKRERAL